jgi:hypothetical protein
MFAQLKFIGKFVKFMEKILWVMEWWDGVGCSVTNVHDDDRRDRPSLVTAELLDQVNEKIRENRRFTMSELSTHFSRFFFLEAEWFSSDDEVKTAMQH